MKIKEWEKRYNDCLFKLVCIPSEQNPNCDNNVLVIYKKIEY